MKKDDIRKILGLDDSIDIANVEESNENGKLIKYVYIKSNRKKVRCPKCNNFTHRIHDYLKPSKVTYLNNSGIETYLIVRKRRFECEYCNKSFTEELNLTVKRGSISYASKQLILKDMMNRNKTIEEIARDYNVSSDMVRNIFLGGCKTLQIEYIYFQKLFHLMKHLQEQMQVYIHLF